VIFIFYRGGYFTKDFSTRYKRSRPRSIDGSSDYQNVNGFNESYNLNSSSSFSQCRRFYNQKEFYVIGHAGGDPVKHCENTLEATRYLFLPLYPL